MNWIFTRVFVQLSMNVAVFLPAVFALLAIGWEMIRLWRGTRGLGGVAVAWAVLIGTFLAWGVMEVALSQVESEAEASTYVITGALLGSALSLLWIPGSWCVRHFHEVKTSM